LAIFSSRLAPKKTYFQLFLVCMLPVHIWAIIIFFRRLDSFTIFMNVAQMISIASYVLVYALLESLFIFALLFASSLLLPSRVGPESKLALGTTIALVASAAAVLIHLDAIWKVTWLNQRQWTWLWAGVSLLLIALISLAVFKNERLESWFNALVERLSLLSMVYLAADILGLMVILYRQLR
jgi:hypothetical protein